jgi:hypothetical protein
VIRAFRRKYLANRAWHKIVLSKLDGSEQIKLRTEIKEALRRCTGEVMRQSGGHWHVIMVESDEDLVFLKVAIAFPPSAYRGKQDWSK